MEVPARFSRETTFLLSSSRNGRILVHNVTGSECFFYQELKQTQDVRCLNLAGPYLVSAVHHGRMKRWKLESNSLKFEFDTQTERDFCCFDLDKSFDVSSNGKIVFGMSDQQKNMILAERLEDYDDSDIGKEDSDSKEIDGDLESSKTNRDRISVLRGHEDIICSIRYAKGQNRLFSAGKDHALIVWNLQKMNVERILAMHHKGDIFSLEILGGGAVVLSGGKDRKVKAVRAVGTPVDMEPWDERETSMSVYGILKETQNSIFCFGKDSLKIWKWDLSDFLQKENLLESESFQSQKDSIWDRPQSQDSDILSQDIVQIESSEADVQSDADIQISSGAHVYGTETIGLPKDYSLPDPIPHMGDNNNNDEEQDQEEDPSDLQNLTHKIFSKKLLETFNLNQSKTEPIRLTDSTPTVLNKPHAGLKKSNRVSKLIKSGTVELRPQPTIKKRGHKRSHTDQIMSLRPTDKQKKFNLFTPRKLEEQLEQELTPINEFEDVASFKSQVVQLLTSVRQKNTLGVDLLLKSQARGIQAITKVKKELGLRDNEIESLQDEVYKITDDFIDKYYDLKEDQNDQIDTMMESLLLKLGQGQRNMALAEELGAEAKSLRQDNQTLKFKNVEMETRVLQLELRETQRNLEQRRQLALTVERKLGKCLGVKKKLESWTDFTQTNSHDVLEAESSLQKSTSINENNRMEARVRLKSKYAEYLFEYLNELLTELQEFHQNQTQLESENSSQHFSEENNLGSRFSKRGEPSVFSSKRKFPRLEAFEKKFEQNLDEIKALSKRIDELSSLKIELEIEKEEFDIAFAELNLKYSEALQSNERVKKKIKRVKAVPQGAPELSGEQLCLKLIAMIEQI